jgi:hypothetical protein
MIFLAKIVIHISLKHKIFPVQCYIKVFTQTAYICNVKTFVGLEIALLKQKESQYFKRGIDIIEMRQTYKRVNYDFCEIYVELLSVGRF